MERKYRTILFGLVGLSMAVILVWRFVPHASNNAVKSQKNNQGAVSSTTQPSTDTSTSRIPPADASVTVSVQYPEGWVLKGSGMLYSPDQAKQIIGDYVPEPSAAIYVVAGDIANVESYLDQYQSCIENITDITVASHPAKQLRFTCTMYPSTDVVYMLNGRLVRAVMYERSDVQNTIVNTILPTVKF